MTPTVLPELITLPLVWTMLILPDKVRDSIRFQVNSLGVLEYSFDAGVSYMKTVGAGEVLLGNFSLRTIWFRTTNTDSVKIMTLDKLY